MVPVKPRSSPGLTCRPWGTHRSVVPPIVSPAFSIQLLAACGRSRAGRVASAAGREAATQSMRDISEKLRQSDCPAPPQPEGQPGFSPIALLLVVGDEP